MSNLLQGKIADPDGGLYSARVLGFGGQDCEFDGVALTNTCMFRSSIPEITLENWDDYFLCSLDLGFQKEGFITHPQFAEVYIKPNIYSDQSDTDIWIEIKNKQTSLPSFNQNGNDGILNWFNFNKSNVLNHPIVQANNINNISTITQNGAATYQDNIAVFMFSDITQKYHAFICNSNKQVFISEGLDNLDAIVVPSVSFYPIGDVGNVAPSWNQTEEDVYIPENTVEINKFSFVIQGSFPITYSIDSVSQLIFDVDPQSGNITFKNAPDYEAGNNYYQITLTATNNFGSSDITIDVHVTNVVETPPQWSAISESIEVVENTTTVTRSAYLTQGEQPITYSMSGTDAGLFNVNYTTGEISFKAPPDYETDPTQYTVTLTATNDAGGDSIDLQISILDIFDPQTKQELINAIDLWESNRPLALANYGDINSWVTTAITDMSELFQYRSSFNDDISSWDTSNVINMSRMFHGASNFNQPLNDWDTGNGTNFSLMFRNAGSFNEPIGDWSTSNVIDMSQMFDSAFDFNQPLDSWDTSHVSQMSRMFTYAGSFNQSLNSWNTGNVTDMASMFRNAYVFNGDIGNWDVSSVLYMPSMFQGTIFNKPINSWNVSSVVWMQDMFRSSDFNQPLNNWNTINVQDMSGMFRFSEFFNQEIDSWNTSNVTNMSGMFRDAKAFNRSLSAWDTASVVTMEGMFRDNVIFDSSLTSWDTSSVNNMAYMFYNAQAFNQPLNSWNVSAVNDINRMFFNAISFNQPLDQWVTSSFVNLERTFQQSSSFNQPLNNWDTSSVTSMKYIFWKASSFNQPLNNWDTGSVADMEGVFAETSFNQPLNNWDTGSVTSMRAMFAIATAFDQPIGSWNISSLINCDLMFLNATLSSVNYDNLLNGWASLDQGETQIPTDLNLDAGGSQYTTAGQTARNTLENTYGWEINDGGLV